MAKDDTPEEPGTALAITDQTQLERFAQYVTLVPAEDEDGWTNIFETLLAAGKWEDVNAPWESSKAGDLIGKRLICRGAKRRPSDFRDGLGFFVVMDCVDYQTSEKVVFITGSVAVVGQTVMMYVLKAVPFVFEIIIADRPTKAGYKPHHIRIIESMGPGINGHTPDASQ